MMMFDGAGDSTDYLGAVFIIVSISAGGGAGAGAPWDRHIRRYEHRTHRHKRYPSGGWPGKTWLLIPAEPLSRYIYIILDISISRAVLGWWRGSGSIAGDHRTLVTLASLFSAQTKCFTPPAASSQLSTKLPTAGEWGAEYQQYRNYLHWNLTVMFPELVLRPCHRLSPGSALLMSRGIFTQQSTNSAVERW